MRGLPARISRSPSNRSPTCFAILVRPDPFDPVSKSGEAVPDMLCSAARVKYSAHWDMVESTPARTLRIRGGLDVRQLNSSSGVDLDIRSAAYLSLRVGKSLDDDEMASLALSVVIPPFPLILPASRRRAVA
jgi:hypothetical protein